MREKRGRRGAAVVGARRALAMVVALTLLLVSCGTNDAEDVAADGDADTGDATPVSDAEPLRIGLLLPTGGVYATIGEQMQQGFELFLEENDWTLQGREVELIVEDTEANPEVGLRAANKLIEDDQVDFAAGVVSSAVALAVGQAFDDAGIPLVISNAIGTVVTAPDQRLDHVFRVSTSGWQLSAPYAEWVYQNVTSGPLAISVPDYAAGEDFAQTFRHAFEALGGEIVLDQRTPFPDVQDYQPYLSEIRASGAEALYAFYAGSLGVNFVTQYDQFGLKDNITFLATLATVTEDNLEAQGDSAEGVYYSTPWTAELDVEANARFLESFEAEFGVARPLYVAPMSYDAAQLIAIALEATGGDTSDSQALLEAMRGAVIDSPRGEVEIDAETQGTVQNIYVVQVQDVDGELIAVVIDDLGRFGEQPNG